MRVRKKPLKTHLDKVEIGICLRLKEAREALGFTQEACAKIVGIAKARLANYELCRAALKADVAFEFCTNLIVNERWLGGLLTNFATIQRSLGRLRDLETAATDGRYDSLSKKEIARNEKEKRKLLKNLEGIRHMARLPDAIFVVDTRKEKIAVDEARKLKIPVIGVVDTNCDPDEVDYVIPGNDDALRAIRLFSAKIADAVVAGRDMRESRIAEEDRERAEEAAAADSAARLTRAVRPQRRTETPTPA